MSILEKLISKKSAADSVSADVQLDRDLGNAVATALARGVHLHRVIEMLERQERSARSRMAAGLRF